jgi:hypothetical protein
MSRDRASAQAGLIGLHQAAVAALLAASLS